MGLGHGVVLLKQDFEVEKGSICLLKKEIDHQDPPVAYLLARVNELSHKEADYVCWIAPSDKTVYVLSPEP